MLIAKEFVEIYRYRELLRNLIVRDVKKRYKRSTLGFLWVMLDPLLMMLVFYIIFSGIFGRTVNDYTAYVISGLTIWQLFSQGTKVSSLSFIQNRSLISKIYLPKSIFPISVVGSSLVHFIFSLVPLFIIILLAGTKISINMVFIPFVVVLIFLFAAGVSLGISTLAVFFHDVVYIYDVLLMAWMYLSAIFYPVSILQQKLQTLMYLNPVYNYIALFRGCLYDKTIPLYLHLSIGIFFSFLAFLIGWLIYSKNKDRIVLYL